jgi:signal transduction histidine kinase
VFCPESPRRLSRALLGPALLSCAGLSAGGLEAALPAGLSASHAGGADRPLLTSLQKIRALSSRDAERAYPVRVRGVVTHFDERGRRNLMIHDGRVGLGVVAEGSAGALAGTTALTQGDLIEIEGATIRGAFATEVALESIRRLGRAALPGPRTLSYSALLAGRHECDYVEVVGVGQRAWRASPPATALFLDVAVEGGTVRASFWDFAPEDVGRFIDARVRIVGNVGGLFSPAEQLRGVTLLAGRARGVVVEEAAPAPFALPPRPISSLGRYSLSGDPDRRLRVRGVVVHRQLGTPVEIRDAATGLSFQQVRNALYVQDQTGSVRVETEQQTSLQPGDRVDVAGFPAVTPTKPVLRAGIVHVLGSEREPAPAPLVLERALSPDHDAALVRTQGSLLGMVTHSTERVLVLKAGALVFDAVVDLKAVGAGLDSLRPGSVVSVTGVYVFQWGPPPSFRILMRSPRDVTLLREAPWWTFRHTLVVLAILGVVASGAAVWAQTIAKKNALIRRQYRAILAERSRLARELHDTLEQGLAGINLQLEAVSGSLEASTPAAKQSLDVARQMLHYCLDEARRSVMDLRSQALDVNDLPAALAEMAQRMTVGSKVRAEVRVTGVTRPLDASEEHHLLRIGLEALTNTIKHADATAVWIDLRFLPDATELVVRDDGHGFPPAGDDMPGGHFGLQGIRERVDKLGGSLSLNTRPSGGLEIAVRVPWGGVHARDASGTED